MANRQAHPHEDLSSLHFLGEPYYHSPGFTLYNADSLEFLDKLPSDCVNMIFADPPYKLSNDGFTCHAGKRVSVNKGKWDKSGGVEADLRFHQAWVNGCRRVLAENGTLWISGTYHSIYTCGHALQLAGFHILNDIAWFKPNAPPNLSTRFFTASHETLIWARKSKKGKHTFNYKLMREGAWPEDSLKKPGKQMRSAWSINTTRPAEKKFGKHPTQKPEALLKRLVLASTNEGDLVLDPFTGSSTTGLMAYMYGREFVGLDLEEEYLELSIKRFEDLRGRLKRGGRQEALPTH